MGVNQHTVITMTDSEYFKFGAPLLWSRKRVKAHFICYGCNLTEEQIDQLIAQRIEHRPIDEKQFKSKLNSLKFDFILKEHLFSKNITFVDWDTFFVRDWFEEVYKNNYFHLGISIRNEAIKQNNWKCASNGGVIFYQSEIPSRNLLLWMKDVINRGQSKYLPEYDTIWGTLEDATRPDEKRYFRTNHSWWVDQVMLSAIVMSYAKTVRDRIDTKVISFLDRWYIGLFDCKRFNNVYISPSTLEKTMNTKGTYICHLKNQGRGMIEGIQQLLNI